METHSAGDGTTPSLQTTSSTDSNKTGSTFVSHTSDMGLQQNVINEPVFAGSTPQRSYYDSGGAGSVAEKSGDTLQGVSGASMLSIPPGGYRSGPWSKSSVSIRLERHDSGSAASILGIPPGCMGGAMSSSSHPEDSEQQLKEKLLDLPHSVLQMVATSLQCDVIVAGVLHNPTRYHETVLCVPKGLIKVPVRLSKGLLSASTCEVRQVRPPQDSVVYICVP